MTDKISLVVFIALAFFIAWQYSRYGRFTGRVLDARITKTIGEVALSSRPTEANVLKVHVLETPPGTTPQIALALESKGIQLPIKLSHPEATQLIDLLQQATG